MKLCCINKLPTKSNHWSGTDDGGVRPSFHIAFLLAIFHIALDLSEIWSLCWKPAVLICQQHVHLSLSGLPLRVSDRRWMDDRLHSPLSIHLRNDRISPCVMEGWMDGWKTDEYTQSIAGRILGNLGNLHWFYSCIAPPSGCPLLRKKIVISHKTHYPHCCWCCIKPEAFSR